ncbi:iron ABC transporter substrate-binding protein [Candidatus Bathyarchaeota archaeon]|nr:MAG: iron ABC transporter substrate-binding protein [Candidatus Bathyarchaeota archaeon]
MVRLFAVVSFAILLFTSIPFTRAEPRIVRDTLAREVQVPLQVRRIVAIGPGALRLVVFLEAQHMVVGVEHGEKKWPPAGRPYRIAHPELAELPIIGLAGPSPTPNPEAILGVKPDVIFATYISRKQADQLQRTTGKPVVVLSYGPLGNFYSEEIFQSLKIAGKLLGKEERAEALIQFIQGAFRDLQQRTKVIPEEKKPKVYIGALGFKGGHGIESTECDFPPFVVVNAKNVLGECRGHRFVDKEFLIAKDPDVIFLDLANLALIKQDYAKHKAFYQSLKAFKEGKVYGVLPFNWYTTNVETSIADAYFIGKVLYPERFEDIDPESKARKVFRFFVGKDVYDEMKKAYGGFGRIDFSRW